MTDIGPLGPHLLGRIPNEPDARDYKLEAFVGSADASPLDLAFAALIKSHAAKATKDWATQAMPYLRAVTPLPTPTPPTPPTPTPTGDKVWPDAEAPLNQGQTGTCVGNGWAQWGNTLPVDDKFDEAAARQIYLETTTYDYGVPDTTLQKGASVRSGAKAMQDRKRLSAYAFASTIEAIASYVQTTGPVVIGSDWTNDMFSPNSSGYITPTGPVEGGHCYVLLGDLPSEDAFEFLNSWGSGWGKGGHFKMKKADFKKLLDANGDACAAVELPL
jgi:hypothetical protein